jgi:sulfite exporter TauE/SafE/copper chaperone CopZ
MHCKACELLIEDALGEVAGVKKVTANHKTGEVQLKIAGEPNYEAIAAAIKKTGYKVGEGGRSEQKNPPQKKDKWQIFGISLIIVGGLALILKMLGVEKLQNLLGNNYDNLGIVVLVGITAGFSTCMALVGGLVLSISAKTEQKMKAHILFNIGRVIGFAILGGILGLIGEKLRLSIKITGVLTIVVGAYMLLLGIQLTGLFEKVNKISLTLPKSWGKKIKLLENPALLGALTFFLPCGFTQAMQLFAMGSGSILTGAMTMGVFALGTAPALLGIGGLTKIMKAKWTKYFLSAAGIVVILFAGFNIRNGYNMTGGIKFGGEESVLEEETSGEVQLIKATYNPKEFTPKTATVKVNQPVRIEVYAETDGRGCMGSFMIPGLDDKAQYFKKGETVVSEFTPKKTGTYQMTCAMGLPHGTLIVEK